MKQQQNPTTASNEANEANEAADSVRFWGVRGSIPSPGPHTAQVGGNTSCVEVNLAGERVIIDGGSGLRQLGTAHGALPLDAHLLFSHLHWDHIQGVPFCGPLYNPRSRVRMLGPADLHAALAKQMSGPTFPVSLEVMGARLSFEPIRPGATLRIGAITVRTAPLSHPGGAIGYRLEHAGRAVVYASDTEHPEHGLDAALLELAANADVLIYDAQYTPEEYPQRVGWGHSTWLKGCELAEAARARALVLFHHDPTRDDDAVAAIEATARARFAGARAAREGLVLTLDTRGEAKGSAGAAMTRGDAARDGVHL
ncbi:MAG: MBL fold metallo-hydrolase [Myxococcales bacterium]|nr:MBL fold metallo-hydrolase [Myxococcales bacterium]